jgi:Spy/CpxP family protein refolding chaperone
MKIDTRIIAALLMVLIYLSTGKLCQAQPSGGGRPPRMTADQIVSDMKKTLDLSDEQAEQILPLIKEEMEKNENSSTRRGPPDFGSILKKYLTGEQMTKWEEQESERRSRMGRGPGGGMGGGPPDM